MIPSLTITTVSSSSSSNHLIDVTPESYDVNDGTHDSDGSCDSSDAVTEEDTIIGGTNNLSKQFATDRGVSGSHDSKDDSSTAEDNSHDPDRGKILNKIYQKYMKDREMLVTGHNIHRLRKKKVLRSMPYFHNFIILLATKAHTSLHTTATPIIRYDCHDISCYQSCTVIR